MRINAYVMCISYLLQAATGNQVILVQYTYISKRSFIIGVDRARSIILMSRCLCHCRVLCCCHRHLRCGWRQDRWRHSFFFQRTLQTHICHSHTIRERHVIVFGIEVYTTRIEDKYNVHYFSLFPCVIITQKCN